MVILNKVKNLQALVWCFQILHSCLKVCQKFKVTIKLPTYVGRGGVIAKMTFGISLYRF